MTRYQINTWKVTIILGDGGEEGSQKTTYYFASEGLALLAIEWAYAVRVESLRARSDVHVIEEYPDLDDGRWKFPSSPGKKVSWWKESAKGFTSIKDYFYYDLDEYKREVIGDEA